MTEQTLHSRLKSADPMSGVDVHPASGQAGQFIAEGSRRERTARRRRVGVGGALVALGLVVVPLTGGPSGATPAAAEVLRRSATMTVTDAPAAPTQLWQINSSGWGVTLTARNDPAGGADPVYAAYAVSMRSSTFVPVDGAAQPVRVQSDADWVVQVSGPSDAQPPAPSRGQSALPSVMGEGSWASATLPFLASLPRDVGELRTRLYRDAGDAGSSQDDQVFTMVADVLRSGLVPADLRRALFGVLETVPGVDVTDARAPVAGGTAVALGRSEPVNGERQELLLDPSNGQVVGERRVQVQSTDAIPAGCVVLQTLVTRQLVPEMPSPEALVAALPDVTGDRPSTCTPR